MQIHHRRLVPAGALLLGLAGIACGDGKPADGTDLTEAKTDPTAPAASSEPTDVDPAGAEASAGTAVPTGVGDEAGEPAAAETGADPSAGAAEAGAETGPVVPPEEQIKALVTEATNKKTKDERALEALEAAKLLEAKPGDLAKAANKRGEGLLGDPERAAKFFEWAALADPKYPNATFNLAKLAANTGDIARVKELLAEVKKRGGKKLLQQVEFDPSFALVADDPEVLALLR